MADYRKMTAADLLEADKRRWLSDASIRFLAGIIPYTAYVEYIKLKYAEEGPDGWAKRLADLDPRKVWEEKSG